MLSSNASLFAVVVTSFPMTPTSDAPVLGSHRKFPTDPRLILITNVITVQSSTIVELFIASVLPLAPPSHMSVLHALIPSWLEMLTLYSIAVIHRAMQGIYMQQTGSRLEDI